METREDFEERYATASPGVVFGENMVSLVCTCPDGDQPTHWAAIDNSPEAIRLHVSHDGLTAHLSQFSTPSN